VARRCKTGWLSVGCRPLWVALCLFFAGARSPAQPSSGTAPFVFDGDRVYAEIAFVHPDGTSHKALAFVDLGSPSTLLSPQLFKELELDQHKPLTFQLGNFPVHVDSAEVSADPWFPFSVGSELQVEALLPAGVLQKYQVSIDYQRRTLTLAQPGTLKPPGIPVPFRADEKTGLLVVEATIDGRSYPVTVDNGSAYTWLKKGVVEQWLGAHPDWQRGVGAVGPSNMRMAGDGVEAGGILVRIPELHVAGLPLAQVGALGIGPDDQGQNLIDWYSKKNPLPVIGWLGGNVLRNFQLTLDYPNRVSYWLRQSNPDAHDLDQVGLTLKALNNGEYAVAAIVTQNGKPTVAGVEPGDKLIRIGAMETKGATWGALFSALHGKPGDVRTLILERAGQQITIRAKVTAF
jgi:hypothetical protein